MPAVDQTPTFKLNLPTFDLRVWHTYVNENFSIIDSVLQHYLDIENLVGVWRNATEYHAGERAVDGQQGAIYECLLDNVSAASPTTFAQDRVSNPAYWGGFTVKEEFKGVWTNNTPYSIQDFVVSGNIYAVCLTSHTSSPAPAVFGDDAPYWIYLINLTGNILPNIVGHGGSYIRARLDETVTEYRTPTQVRADLGIANIVTSWNTRVGDVTLNATDIANAGGISSVGGSVSGPLVLNNPNNQLGLNGANGTSRVIYAYTSSSPRWALAIADNTVEAGSNTGSNFSIYRYNDAGTLLDAPLTINRASGAVALTGSLTAPANIFSNQLFVEGPVGAARILWGNTGHGGGGSAANRWAIYLANGTAEGGSNSGSDFSINRYTDAGVFIDNPLSINRASGAITVGSGLRSPSLTVDGAVLSSRSIYGTTALSPRFSIELADAGAESGGNAGSNFNIRRYTDAGAFIDMPLQINRASGFTTLSTFVAITNPGAVNCSLNLANSVRNWSIRNLSNNTFDIVDNTAVAQRFVIDSSGNVSIPQGVSVGSLSATGNIFATGNLSCSSGLFGPSLNVNNAPATSRAISFQTNGSQRWAWQCTATAESGSNAGSDFGVNSYNDAGVNIGSVMSIVRATRVVTFAVAIVNSDRRLKTDIAPIKDALTIIDALQGVTYHRKADPEKRQIGLIAQDVREVLPEVVHESAERSEDGDALLGVDYAKIVSVLIEAVKELTERVRQLEART